MDEEYAALDELLRDAGGRDEDLDGFFFEEADEGRVVAFAAAMRAGATRQSSPPLPSKRQRRAPARTEP